MVDFLVHNKGDYVGVATTDLKKGIVAQGWTVDKDFNYQIEVLEDIPLGHKIALRDIKGGEKVIEYGETIGVATKDIRMGEHVHIHNIKSLKWG
ncbi:MAG: UxaA family hydrolase [Pseudothermotoga sp.]